VASRAGLAQTAVMLTVRRLASGDVPAVTAIVRALPDFFTEDVPAKVESDSARHAGWVLADMRAVAAFAVVARKGKLQPLRSTAQPV
jgi:hypothetical protein